MHQPQIITIQIFPCPIQARQFTERWILRRNVFSRIISYKFNPFFTKSSHLHWNINIIMRHPIWLMCRDNDFNFCFHSRHISIPLYLAPSLCNTARIVFSKILTSNPKLHSSIYCLSSATTCSKSVISLRPLTCHMPVSPGLIDIRLLW